VLSTNIQDPRMESLAPLQGASVGSLRPGVFDPGLPSLTPFGVKRLADLDRHEILRRPRGLRRMPWGEPVVVILSREATKDLEGRSLSTCLIPRWIGPTRNPRPYADTVPRAGSLYGPRSPRGLSQAARY
jgi:hypothetical protein